MASSINASTSGAGGVIVTSDASGVLNLQSGGVTVATVQSSGLSLPSSSTFNAANTFGFKNRLINGYFNVWQRGTTVTSVGIDTYGPDRFKQWANIGTETGRSTWSQSTDVPTGQGFQYSCLISVTTAQASFSATQAYAFEQRIEANNMYDFAYGTSGAKSVTVSFWAKTNKTGTYTVAISNDGTSSSNVYKQTVSLTSSWAQYTLVFPGDTSLATNSTGTSQGMFVSIMLTNGTTSAVTNTWQSYSLQNRTATGQVNFYDSTSNTLNITGIQIEVGSQATSFDFRSIGTELLMCQRYYYASTSASIYMAGQSYAAGTVDGLRQTYSLPAVMRATPTGTLSGGTNGGSAASIGVLYSFPSNIVFNLQSTGGGTSVWWQGATLTATAEL